MNKEKISALETKRIGSMIGRVVKHFKEKLYLVLDVCENTETGELMVFYKSLCGHNQNYVRNAKMFASEVDHEKYPEVTQKYRFELLEDYDKS